MKRFGRAAVMMAIGVVVTSSALSGCSNSSGSSSKDSGTITAVAAENEYGDVLSQVGGKYVSVSSIMSDPNTDPHTFEASPSVARQVREARLIVQNGVGYDDFMSSLEKASQSSDRTVITAQTVLGLPDSTPNPHLWYSPKTMPAVANAIAGALSTMQPQHKSYFEQNAATFISSLQPWTQAIAAFSDQHRGTPVAVTEPVADYMLQAAGADILTPSSLETAVMNDTDPSPQDSAAQEALLSDRKVKVFLYNQQVTDETTKKYLELASARRIPVVGVYETMPTDYDYQKWMLAEVDALSKAVTTGASTLSL